MADRILVDTAEMQATITRYNEAQNTMMEAQKSMAAALNNLNACWKGPAWAAMMYKWTQIEANIVNSQLAVNRSVVGLQNTISYNAQAESENVKAGRALDTGDAAQVYVD